MRAVLWALLSTLCYAGPLEERDVDESPYIILPMTAEQLANRDKVVITLVEPNIEIITPASIHPADGGKSSAQILFSNTSSVSSGGTRTSTTARVSVSTTQAQTNASKLPTTTTTTDSIIESITELIEEDSTLEAVTITTTSKTTTSTTSTSTATTITTTATLNATTSKKLSPPSLREKSVLNKEIAIDIPATSTAEAASTTATSTAEEASTTATSTADAASTTATSTAEEASTTATSTAEAASTTTTSKSGATSTTATSTAEAASTTATSTAEPLSATVTSLSGVVSTTATSTAEVASTTAETASKAEAVTSIPEPATESVSINQDALRIVDTSHWTKIIRFNVTASSSVIKYRSELTGLTVILAESDSPIVNGYFCLATEAHDHDGLPHTLEHLVFLGSEDYPYKEVLDLLANRCLADRTNAWTDTDHTCYTVYTAGSSGFLHILPVYMDHILYPLLREEDYMTEVHHINGEGQDAGVVYSEMQGVEQTTSNIMYFALSQVIYPGNSGYESETGGYLANLRNSTSIQKVRDYHKEFYRPENLVLTITGRLEEQALFSALTSTEEKILRKRSVETPAPYIRPWQKQLEKIRPDQDKEIRVEVPADDESLGNIAVAWRLPQTISGNITMLQAYELLMKYLASTQVSPLEAEFVEAQDPLATSVSADMLEVREPAILIEFENVPLQRIDEVIPKMEQVFQRLVDDGPERFDIERIHNFIDRAIVNHLKETENSPHLFVPDATVLDMLYGDVPQHLKEFVLASNLNKKFRAQNATFWLDLIDKLFVKTPKYYVKAIPSKLRQEQITREETLRLARQRADLGEQGLKHQKEIVDKAIRSQNLPSSQVLSKIPFGDVNTINFRSFSCHNRSIPSSLVDFQDVPFKIHIDDVNSKFVKIFLFMDTTVLNQRERSMLPLLLDTWLLSPILKDGEVTPIEVVVKRRSQSLLQVKNTLGFDGSTFTPGSHADAFIIEAQAELKKFDKAISYLSDAINFPYFTDKKVSSSMGNLLNNIPALKQSATDVLRVLFDDMFFNKNTVITSSGFIRQKVFLEGLQAEIKEQPDKVVREIYSIVEKLANPNTAFLYLGANLRDLTDRYGRDLLLLRSLFNRTDVQKNRLADRFDVKSEFEYRRKHRNSSWSHVIYSVGGTESCYLKHSIDYNNTDWNHPQVADIRVMLQYISDRMYDGVRGKGLTYGVSMSVSVTEGRIVLAFSRASRMVEAFSAVRGILKQLREDPDAWDSTLVDSARGSMIYSWAEKEETVESLLDQAVRAYIRKTDSAYNRKFVHELAETSTERIKKLASELLPAFEDSRLTQTVIVCNPGVVPDIVQQFKQFDIELNVIDNLESSFLADVS